MTVSSFSQTGEPPRSSAPVFVAIGTTLAAIGVAYLQARARAQLIDDLAHMYQSFEPLVNVLVALGVAIGLAVVAKYCVRRYRLAAVTYSIALILTFLLGTLCYSKPGRGKMVAGANVAIKNEMAGATFDRTIARLDEELERREDQGGEADFGTSEFDKRRHALEAYAAALDGPEKIGAEAALYAMHQIVLPQQRYVKAVRALIEAGAIDERTFKQPADVEKRLALLHEAIDASAALREANAKFPENVSEYMRKHDVPKSEIERTENAIWNMPSRVAGLKYRAANDEWLKISVEYLELLRDNWGDWYVSVDNQLMAQKNWLVNRMREKHAKMVEYSRRVREAREAMRRR